jgi:hypothetical protein
VLAVDAKGVVTADAVDTLTLSIAIPNVVVLEGVVVVGTYTDGVVTTFCTLAANNIGTLLDALFVVLVSALITDDGTIFSFDGPPPIDDRVLVPTLRRPLLCVDAVVIL